MAWSGERMDDGRIPRDVLCGELGDAPQRVGIPKLRFRYFCINNLQSFGISTTSWGELCQNLLPGAQSTELLCKTTGEIKRSVHHHLAPIDHVSLQHPICGCQDRAIIGLTSWINHLPGDVWGIPHSHPQLTSGYSEKVEQQLHPLLKFKVQKDSYWPKINKFYKRSTSGEYQWR